MPLLTSLPVQYDSATVGDIATWVATNKLHQPNLLPDVIQIAAETYLVIASKVPFECFELITAEQTVTAGTQQYDLQQFSINRIHSIRMSYNTNQSMRLKRNDARAYDAISSPIQSRPSEYARWGSTIELYPIPDSNSYTYRLRFYQAPTLTVDGQGGYGSTLIVTPPEWNKLLKMQTLYETYIHLDEFDKARALMEPSMMPRYPHSPKRTTVHEVGIIPQLWNDLLETIKMRERGDEDFGINPVYRSYSMHGNR